MESIKSNNPATADLMGLAISVDIINETNECIGMSDERIKVK